MRRSTTICDARTDCPLEAVKVVVRRTRIDRRVSSRRVVVSSMHVILKVPALGAFRVALHSMLPAVRARPRRPVETLATLAPICRMLPAPFTRTRDVMVTDLAWLLAVVPRTARVGAAVTAEPPFVLDEDCDADCCPDGVVGLGAGAAGVTAVELDDAVLVPTRLAATTLKVYAVPLVRPVTVQDVCGGVAVHVAPPGAAVTV